MSKITITNLDNLVSGVIDGVVTSNVNVVAAQQAVLDSQAAAASSEAGKNLAEAAKSASELAAANSEVAKSQAEVYAISTGENAAIADERATYAEGQAALAELARVTAEQHRDTAINVLAQTQLVYDHFDDRYLGGHSSDPIRDNDGDDIVDGALYWNTANKALMLYNQTAGEWRSISESSGALLAASNLGDLPDVVEARNNLDVYSKSEVDSKDILSKDRANHIGTQSIDTVTDSATHVKMEVDERTKLAGIEDGATGDQTGAEIKALYEAQADTNAYTDDEKTRVAIGTGLNTTSQTLPGAVNEVHGELDAHKAATAAHGVGEVVGTTEVQTLTNKTLNDVSNEIHADVLHYEVQATTNILRGQPLVATGTTDDTVIKVGLRTNYSQPVIGIAQSDIPQGTQGTAISTGVMANIVNASSWNVGDILYAGLNGALTKNTTIDNTRYNQPLAYVVKANPAQVTLIVNVHSGHDYASMVAVTPQGNLSGTTVQLALEELQADIDSLLVDVEW